MRLALFLRPICPTRHQTGIVNIALVHDWLTGMRGGEKCLEVFCEMFPDADLFTLIHVPGSVSPAIERRRIVTSMLQRWPGSRRGYRHYLPLMPTAIEMLDLQPYDLVLSSSHCVAKGVLPRPDAIHVSYVHTPMRYAWDRWAEYFGRGGLRRILAAPLLNYLRTWDASSSPRVDRYVANSNFVAQRIMKYYRRSATVIPPPVDCNLFNIERERGQSYLMVSAMVPYKRIDLVIEVFNRLGRPLTIVGDGPLRRRLTGAAGPTVQFTGWLADAELREHYARARAVILPAVEDFGIVPLEANAAGRPVIALGRGGSLDTVVPLDGDTDGDGPTGVFFDSPDADSLTSAIRRFEDHEERFDPEVLRRHARRFDRPRFRERMQRLIDGLIDSPRPAPERGKVLPC